MLLALVLGVSACGGGADDSTAAPPALGSAPLVERTPDQFEQDLAGLRGDVVVVNFWASWCGPCREEMPDFQQVSTEYESEPVTFIGVDVSDVREEAAAFLKEAGATYPTVYDRKGLNGGIATAWSVTALPQTWFVAPDGTRSGRIPRQVSADELRERIDRLLSSS